MSPTAFKRAGRIPVFHTMANNKKAATKKGTSNPRLRNIADPMRVTIPAGKIYTIHNLGDEVYVVENGLFPDKLALMFKEAQEKAYQEGLAAGRNEAQMYVQNCCAIQKSPQEVTGEVLTAIRQLHVGDQNEVFAQVQKELRLDRSRRVEALQEDYQRFKGQMDNAQVALAGFDNVTRGGLETLGFR